MTVYVLIYDVDYGSREDCNIFYSPIEVFSDAKTRQDRIDFITSKNPDIGCRTEDLDFMTDVSLTWESSIFGWDDDEDDDIEEPEDIFGELEKASKEASIDPQKSANPNAAIFDIFRAFGEDIPEVEEDDEDEPGEYDGIDPDQILFHVREEDDPWGGDGTTTMVYIAPKEYFEKHGYMYDQYFESGLPKCFSECSENMFEYRGSVDEARNRLLSDGYVEDKKFAQHINKDC